MENHEQSPAPADCAPKESQFPVTDELIATAEKYAAARGWQLSTLANRVFNRHDGFTVIQRQNTKVIAKLKKLKEYIEKNPIDENL